MSHRTKPRAAFLVGEVLQDFGFSTLKTAITAFTQARADIVADCFNARYYDPEVGRFISQDSIKYIAPETLNGINLFAYCLNNPVMGYDPDGTWVETVFDLFSLGVSIVEVVINPLDPWAGLAGDAFDLIPFVTGAGETIKGMKLVVKGVDFADMTIDTIRIKKAIEFTVEAQKKIKTLKKVGKYTESAADAGKIIHNGYRVKNYMLMIC